jgi:hypothetical protein
VVEHGRTGFLVESQAEMAACITKAAELDPEVCRAAARLRFSVHDTVRSYLALYERLISDVRHLETCHAA